jgi:DNA repair protein RadC
MDQRTLQSLFRVNEVELIYRNKIPYQDRIQITRSATAYEILLNAWDENRMEMVEEFKILLLDQKNNCLGISDISTGSISGCLADPKVIFATALKARATGLILAHNHPSGAPRKRIDVMYNTENQFVPVFGVNTAVRGAGRCIKTYIGLKPP